MASCRQQDRAVLETRMLALEDHALAILDEVESFAAEHGLDVHVGLNDSGWVEFWEPDPREVA